MRTALYPGSFDLVTFGHVAGTYVLIAVALDWFIKHYIFRWRTAMNDFYMANWTQLREIEGMSYEDIAKIMDCPIGTVRSRIFRAREAIAEQLKPLLDAKDKRW